MRCICGVEYHLDGDKPHPVDGKLLVADRDRGEWSTENGIVIPVDDEEGDYRRVVVVDPGATAYVEGDEVLVRPTAGGTYRWVGRDAKTRELRVIAENEIFVYFRK